MPKQTHFFMDFSGGENISANPKTLQPNELQLLQGMFADERGYLTTLYPPQKSPDAAHLKDFGLAKSLIKGTSLFYFRSDYSFVSDGNWATNGPYHYIMICDRSVDDATSYVSITDGSTLKRNALLLGSRNFIPHFYKYGNNIRIVDATYLSTPQGQFWLGPIVGSSGGTKKIMGAEISKRWHSEINNLASPTYGLAGRVAGTGHGDSDTTSIVPVRVTDLAGTATIADNSGVVRFTASSHGMLDGDTVIISGSEYYSGSHTVVNESDHTFEISKVWLGVATGETPEWRRKGDPDWFAGFGTGGTDIASAASASKWFISWSNQSTTEMRKCTAVSDNDITTSTATAYDAISFEIYPYPGVGVNIDVYQSRGSDKGAWPPGDYEFGQTFVYNDDQESLISKMAGDNVTIDANEVLYCKVLFTGLNVSAAVPNTTGAGGNSDVNPRIERGRIYARKSGTGDEWILLVDCDLRTSNAAAGGGTRLNLTDSLDSWNVRSAGNGEDIDGNIDSTVGRWRGFYSTQYTIKSPSPFTYEAINGFSQDEPVLGFGAAGLRYRTSVIANSRAFVANLDYYDVSGNLRGAMGDAILYSPPNKVDTFPPSYRLDIAEGDGDEFTCLMESGGKLLGFKESALYIIDITNPNPAGWRLENRLVGLGVRQNCSSIRVENGVAFANYHGCWIYENNQLVNLIQGKISVSQWQNFIGSPTNEPNIGYDSISKKLIIVNNNENVDKYLRFYDFITKSWSRSHGDGSVGDKGISTFLNYSATFGRDDYDEARNTWSNFVTIPEASKTFTAGHGNKGGGAVVYLEEHDDITNSNLIKDAVNTSFSNTSNWQAHEAAGTVTFTNSSTGTQRLRVAGNSNTGEQGVKLVDAYIDGGTDPVDGKTYMISVDLYWTTTDPEIGAVFKIQYGGATTAAFAVTGTSATTYHKYITATSTDNELQIYYEHANTTQWNVDVVQLGEVKADLRWFALKRNVVDYSNAIVDGDAKANRSLYNIVTREEHFGAPFNLKKIYAVTIDYITENTNGTFAFDLRYQINGNIQNSDLGTDWMSVTDSPLIVGDQSTTGLATPNEVNTIRIHHSSFSATTNKPIKCHSIAFQIHNSDVVTRQFVKILNIGVEYRIIKKVAGTEATAVGDATL